MIRNKTTDTQSVFQGNRHTGYLQLLPGKFGHDYGCHLLFTNDDETHEVKFEMNIKHVGISASGRHLLSLNREKETVCINDRQPEILVDKLAADAGSILYPLVVEMETNGAIRSVANYAEIKKRWTRAKEKISNYYKGADVEKYLVLMEERIYAEDLLQKSLEYDFFLAIYFAPVYQRYDVSQGNVVHQSFPMNGQCKPQQYKICYKAEPELNDFGAITIHGRGILADDRSMHDLELQLDYPFPVQPELNPGFATGNFNATYFLDAATKVITDIEAFCTLDLSNKKAVSAKIYRQETKPEKRKRQQEQNKKEQIADPDFKSVILDDIP